MRDIKVLIAYATTDGHTGSVAESIAALMLENSIDVTINKLTQTTCLREIAQYDGVIVGGSIHYDRHQRSLQTFVKKQRHKLSAHRSIFFSVSNAAASASSEGRACGYMDKFFAQTNWNPDRRICVGGALKYRQYGLVKKWIMRRISEKNGLPTDTSRDHVLTDWPALESFFQQEADYLKNSAMRQVA